MTQSDARASREMGAALDAVVRHKAWKWEAIFGKEEGIAGESCTRNEKAGMVEHNLGIEIGRERRLKLAQEDTTPDAFILLI